MYLIHSDSRAKGWSIGPFNSSLPISVGYANEGINERHYHKKVVEIYLVARGTSQVEINGSLINLQGGDVLVVEPSEVHTFLQSSPDYFHFVVHSPGLTGEAAKSDKVLD